MQHHATLFETARDIVPGSFAFDMARYLVGASLIAALADECELLRAMNVNLRGAIMSVAGIADAARRLLGWSPRYSLTEAFDRSLSEADLVAERARAS